MRTGHIVLVGHIVIFEVFVDVLVGIVCNIVTIIFWSSTERILVIINVLAHNLLLLRREGIRSEQRIVPILIVCIIIIP